MIKIKKKGKAIVQPTELSIFKGFTEDQINDVDDLLLQGNSAPSVVAYVRDKYGLWGDYTDENIRRYVSRYRQDKLRPRAAKAASIMEEVKGPGFFGKSIDALEEMRKLIEIQRTRFLKLYEKEFPGPLLMSSVTSEGVTLQRMLVDYAKLQLETGALRKAPQRVSGTHIDEAGHVKSFSWTVEQDVLFRALEETAYAGESA